MPVRSSSYPTIGKHTSRTWQAAHKVGIDLRSTYDTARPEQEQADIE